MVRNTKKLIFLCIFLLLPIPSLNAQWIDVASPVTTTLRDVCFADSLNGWAVGDTSTIIHTSDGGYNWIIQDCPISNFNLGRVQFVNKDIGFITAGKGTILKTSNGGMNWNPIIIDTLFNNNGLFFLNPDTGWVVGGGNTFPTRTFGVILKTTNGGNTWTKQYETDSSMFPVEDNFNDIKFINAMDGYAVTGIEGTFLYTTTNGGVDWDRKGFSDLPLYHIDVISKDTVWGCGNRGFASTADNGFNWTYGSSLGASGKDLKMITPTSGYVLAVSFTERKLVFTTNGGESFSETWAYSGPILEAMYINSSNSFICTVGNSGRIVLNNNFLTIIHEISQDKIGGFNLSQNYPNPFNPSTTISYILPVESDVQIAIYDLIGGIVKTLISNSQSAGYKTAVWDGKNDYNESVASGIYICTIKAVSLEGDERSFTKSSKLVLMK
jgi:photosystem II stability/assembly factor-like uncharacterized protein